MSRALGVLSRQGLRQARPGEFTQRAFLHGKMDLSEAEAVQDLISATARRGAACAMEQLSGALRRRIQQVEAGLLDALSGVDAAIDYPEELEEDVFSALPAALEEARESLEGLIQTGRQGRVLREGVKAVILGLPNAGKSSLLNALVEEERAIVTPQAGTTRDIVEAQCAMEGLAVRLLDTAGLREAQDAAERIGVDRAVAAAEGADLVLLCLDGSHPLSEAERDLISRPYGAKRLCAVCKADLGVCGDALGLAASQGMEALAVSAKTGQGLDALKKAIARLAAPADMESALVTNSRHVQALEEALAAVESAAASLEGGLDPELAATDLRAALYALGQITGEAVDEAVVERIFSRFCVGK